ncbi:hypothetical protein RFH42_03185 [Acinetobacter rudis]|uniref:hypothetical protein n=1 Tax=Acinetobacter rudis TaxID=632955 RepID=UPI00280F07F9|nr:hypothetical protein [Acinetobacter rudis]MDQ8951958.1 hypothetical protein [Acinetobacter rudis]
MSKEDMNQKIKNLDAEITEMKSDFCVEHLLPNEGEDQLESIITKAIKFGELVAQRDSISS